MGVCFNPVLFFQTKSQVSQAGLKFLMVLPPSSEYWDHRFVSPNLPREVKFEIKQRDIISRFSAEQK